MKQRFPNKTNRTFHFEKSGWPADIFGVYSIFILVDVVRQPKSLVVPLVGVVQSQSLDILFQFFGVNNFGAVGFDDFIFRILKLFQSQAPLGPASAGASIADAKHLTFGFLCLCGNFLKFGCCRIAYLNHVDVSPSFSRP